MSGNEVSGKKGTSLSTNQQCSSAENFNLFCHPCNEDHNRVEAFGFCVECNVYLCGDCIQYHKKLRVTKGHVIQDRESMPKDVRQGQVPQHKDICTKPCTKHHGKVLEYYCESHKEFGCSVCVTLEHITCGVGYIPELANGIVNSKEYEQLIEQIKNFKKSIEETKETTSKSITNVESESKSYTDKVNELGEDLIKHVKYLMQKAIDEKDEFVQKQIFQLTYSKNQCEKMIEEINSMQTELESKINSDNESFVLLKKHPATLKEIKETLKKSLIDSKPTVFQLAKNLVLQSVKEIETFGTLITYKNIVKQLDDINISTKGNETPFLSGIEVLSDGRLAIVDNNNKLVELVDPKDSTITETKLQNEPWDITEVSKGQLAVTLPFDCKIQFLSVTGRNVKIKHLIETIGLCWGIAAHQNKLIVGIGIQDYPTGLVQILDLSGRELRTISSGDNGELFSYPRYFAVNHSNNLIYVSDYDTDTLTCVTLEGKVKFVYSDYDMDEPRGIATNKDGSVFVCGHNSIQHVTEEGRKIQTLLGPGQDGADSSSIAYDKNTGNIFLCGSDGRSMCVYHME